MEIKQNPVIIVGSGIAGLLAALKLSAFGVRSIVATKSRLTINSSRLAQGGIAAVLPENQADSLELHVQDTLKAGAGLVDEAVVRSIVEEGAAAIGDLIELGVPFDRVDGKLVFTKEAAHSTSRILHAGGDATGRSIQDTLIAKTQADPNITLMEDCIITRLYVQNNRCIGMHAVSYSEPDQPKQWFLKGDHIILATGGLGRLYTQTTNPEIATGDGIALAYWAGAKIQDVEFVQFHPTALCIDGQVRFLISEAVRGEGGILRDKDGNPFARNYHPDGELAPRDIVARAIVAQMFNDNSEHVFLDITHLPPETIERRFPTILQNCLKFGVDIRKDWIPVAPAAHYGMGGVWTDTYGQTTIDRLHAVGEVVSTGLHGANRLASNSLLECVVLSRRVAERIAQSLQSPSFEEPQFFAPPAEAQDLYLAENEIVDLQISRLREIMWRYAGISRDGRGLQQALDELARLETYALQEGLFQYVPKGIELKTMLATSQLICQSALSREESRGAHYRIDFPETGPEAHHSIIESQACEGVLI